MIEPYFDSEVMKNLKTIGEEMSKEIQNPEKDGKKIEELNVKTLMEGMKLNTAIRNYNYKPY